MKCPRTAGPDSASRPMKCPAGSRPPVEGTGLQELLFLSPLAPRSGLLRVPAGDQSSQAGPSQPYRWPLRTRLRDLKGEKVGPQVAGSTRKAKILLLETSPPDSGPTQLFTGKACQNPDTPPTSRGRKPAPRLLESLPTPPTPNSNVHLSLQGLNHQPVESFQLPLTPHPCILV